MQKVLIHYAEIGLKGKNRSFFENKLIDNIKRSAKYQNVNLKKVIKGNKRVICVFDDNKGKITKTLRYVLGIKYFCYFSEVDWNIEEIEKKSKDIMEEFKKRGEETVAFFTKRTDKDFSLKSPEINSRLGEIANRLGLKVDYKNSQNKIFIEINRKSAFISSERIEGHAGLPVGTSGRVLVLLSGGIDSPVAAWLMMKRGCTTDFLHIHAYAKNNEAQKSKITKSVKHLNNFQFKSKLFLSPYYVYEMNTLGKVQQKYDLVVFKHYILKLAQSLALKHNYDAIVTGDNLAQVASQTIENLKATSHEIKIPVFRPLLTYEKDEIISLAKKINTYQLSIEEYKDCCSILAKNPSTKTKLKRFEKELENLDMNDLTEKSVKETECFNLD